MLGTCLIFENSGLICFLQ